MKLYTDESDNSTHFIHISCILAQHHDTKLKFLNPAKRKGLKDVKLLKSLKKRGTSYKCQYNENDEKSEGSLIKCSWLKCSELFTLRIALANGHTGVWRDNTLDFVCRKHYKIENNNNIDYWPAYSANSLINQEILAIHPDKRIHKAKILATKRWPRLVVLFDDQSWSEKTPVSDLVSIKGKKVTVNLDNPEFYEKSMNHLQNLSKDGHCEVQIMWDGDEVYDATCYSVEWDDIFYIKYYTPKYKTYFPDSNHTRDTLESSGDIWVSRDQFWVDIDHIPSMYRAKLTFV